MVLSAIFKFCTTKNLFIHLDPCDPSPCLNGGICTVDFDMEGSGADVMCDCANTGFEGDRCEIPSTSTIIKLCAITNSNNSKDHIYQNIL